MDTRGTHLVVEYHECDPQMLDDAVRVEAALRAAAQAAGTTIVASVFHPFFPHGVTGVVVVEESHLSIHTWPETGYAAVDFYTCGDGDPLEAHRVLRQALKPRRFELLQIGRGLASARSLRIEENVQVVSTEEEGDGALDADPFQPTAWRPHLRLVA